MKKSFPTLLATLIWSALYSQQTLADLAEQCMLGVPTYNRPLVTGDANDLPVNIQADKTTANYPDSALFSGNVNIEQGNSVLTAEQVELNQIASAAQDGAPTRTITATGNVRYDDNQVVLQGPKAWSNLNTKDTDVYEGDYQMVGRQGRGSADKMKMRDDNRYTILENGTFTSCLPGDNSWSVVGSEVIQDREEQVAEIWNARFMIGGVPVFYSPYLQLPIGDKRRSGFLIPNAKFGSSNGFELLTPYYWNIAPNFDATITPHLQTKRGMQWQNEFRYLTAPGAGTIQFDWLPSDDEYAKDAPLDDNDTRWLFHWRHNGVMDQVWRFNSDYTKVSDDRYFTDLDSEYGSTTDGYVSQKLSVGYANQNWDTTLSTKQFQVFSTANSRDVYRAEPQLDINYYQNDIGPVDLHLYGQAVKFTNVNDNRPEATRLHIAPALSLPLTNRWGSLNTEAKLLATHYQQDNLDRYRADPTVSDSSKNNLKDRVNRVMPQYKIDGKMVFEREMDWSQGYTQTLEPRAQYLYVPYRNQSDIHTYDSTLLQADYSGLFRDRSYSGLDRIASANQLATGVTSRIYDDELVERFNASVGQIYYFDRPRTGDGNMSLDQSDDNGSMVWAGDAYLKVDDNWGMRGGLQYDARLNEVALGDAVLEYRKDAERLVQLNYRYASPEYIQAMLPNVQNPGFQQGISQVGVTASWPIVDQWAVVGAYYYDTKANQPASQLIGVQYNTCCWAVSVGYERKITDWESNGSVYDNKVSFNIELRGLSNNYSLGSEKMLRSGILPYQRAF
ncbi:LPS assembly protein LptD [Brenneria nigrifluens DSM 30175 = ATCC 13028]|uniref:LPS-assembly protein LptD n=2 Tax=Pectobacteriaceae TaxID=1903410 RepID=A0A2U1UV76_9GAMM|nr:MULTISPECIES: LPS assembly protein LptD [Brenneria]PWC25586.1 LPS assembly protein LptD [Brenneria nigrifluens DSM 30175 = ATCC 13028]QCR03327.1 LPS assembly protein LptD [Brenneria nigrifluens DSM 30175 = ATCC 13028]